VGKKKRNPCASLQRCTVVRRTGRRTGRAYPPPGYRTSVETTSVEGELRRVGKELADALPSPARHPVRALDEKAMELSTQDAELRAALFRLVDVTPATRSLDELASHLTGYLEEVRERPPPLRAAMRMGNTRAGRTALGAAAAAGVRHMAHRFIVAPSPKAAIGELRALWRDGIATTVDLLGEATVTGEEADRYAARCHEAVELLAEAAERWPERPLLEADSAGPIPRANLSVKVTALTPLMRPDAPELGRDDAARRLLPLLRAARDAGAHLHVDMESLDALETTTELFFELLAEDELRAGPSAGIVLQAYLRDSPAQLERMLAFAREVPRAQPLVVRLVKGAYWDHEIVEARQHGWRPPVFEVKAECDRNFEALTRRLLDARPLVRVAIGSHNLRSISHAIAYSRANGGDDRDLELQVLRGLGDDLARALAARGFSVRAYCPVGELVAGMAYLVRRLLENTSNESFLHEQARGAPLEELLAPP
jgi:proline dehydrogenase